MPTRLLNYLLWFLLITNILYVTSGAIHHPLSHVDVWANWFYKAKALYLSDNQLTFLQNWHGEFAHPQYPILLPLLFSTIFSAFGPSEVWPSLLSPIMYGLALLLCFKTLRGLNFTTNQSLVFTYLYSMLSPVLAQGGRLHAGMPDIYIAVIAWLIFYLNTLSQKEARYSWIITALVILASLIKTEGILLAIALLFTSEHWFIKFAQIIISTSGYFYWSYLLTTLGIPASYSFQLTSVANLVYRAIFIFGETVRELFFNIHNWYIFWCLFILGLFSKPNWRDYVPLALFFTTIIGIYLFSAIPIEDYVTSSLDRLLLQISPFWLVPFAQTFKKYLQGNLFRNHDNLIGIRIWELLK